MLLLHQHTCLFAVPIPLRHVGTEAQFNIFTIFIKVTVKFTLAQAVNAQKRSKSIAVLFLLPRLVIEVGGQRHVPAALPWGKRRGIHCIRDWVGAKAGLDGCGKSRLYRDSIPRSSTP